MTRLRWAGYVARMDDICMPRRLMYVQRSGEMKWGGMQRCWDLGVGGVTAMNHEEWERLLEEDETILLVVVSMMMIVIMMIKI
jgi:hypothetical protein